MTLPELLKELDIKYVTQGQSSKVTANYAGMPCPFCRHVSKNGDPNLLGINLRTGYVTCWSQHMTPSSSVNDRINNTVMHSELTSQLRTTPPTGVKMSYESYLRRVQFRATIHDPEPPTPAVPTTIQRVVLLGVPP